MLLCHSTSIGCCTCEPRRVGSHGLSTGVESGSDRRVQLVIPVSAFAVHPLRTSPRGVRRASRRCSPDPRISPCLQRSGGSGCRRASDHWRARRRSGCINCTHHRPRPVSRALRGTAPVRGTDAPTWSDVAQRTLSDWRSITETARPHIIVVFPPAVCHGCAMKPRNRLWSDGVEPAGKAGGQAVRALRPNKHGRLRTSANESG